MFEKLAVGPSCTGQTGASIGQTGGARETPKTLSVKLTLHLKDEVAQVRLGGFVSTL